LRKVQETELSRHCRPRGDLAEMVKEALPSP
jgi:hypothetical protein